MDQKWILALVILMFCHELCSGSEQVVQPREGNQVDIHCPLETELIVWFRVLDNAGIEFLASFTSTGFMKSKSPKFSQLFSDTKMKTHQKLTLKSFKPGVDVGIYSCAALKGNELKFGKVTRLIEEKRKAPTKAPATAVTKQTVVVSTKPCLCKTKTGASDPSMLCAPFILGSLAAGCGLLLLLLIVTILYCNRIRTRRCPHHYKRKLRVAPEKQMMTNRHG